MLVSCLPAWRELALAAADRSLLGGLPGGRFRRKFRSSVLQKLCDLRLRPARYGVCLRPSRRHVFLPHLRVCAPERREYVLRLQEPKNEQKRLREGETPTLRRAAEDWK